MDPDESLEILSVAISQLATAADSLIKRYDRNEVACHPATNMDGIDEDIRMMREALAKLEQLKRESDGRTTP